MWEFCSNLNWDSITAIASVGLLCVTGWAAFSVSSLTRYSHRQNDREVVERIYAIYSMALSDFIKSHDYSVKLFYDLYRAIDLADLYDLPEIRDFIAAKKDKFNSAQEAHDNCYGYDGKALPTHNNEDIKKETDILIELTNDYIKNNDMKIFRKRLHVKK